MDSSDDDEPQPRSRPNILITGTPGTGKTTTSEQVAQQTGLRHINVGQWVKDKGLHSGWNAQFECFDLDEDKVSRTEKSKAQTANRARVEVCMWQRPRAP